MLWGINGKMFIPVECRNVHKGKKCNENGVLVPHKWVSGWLEQSSCSTVQSDNASKQDITDRAGGIKQEDEAAEGLY